jgi:Pentapeptide repeats (8 copies)
LRWVLAAAAGLATAIVLGYVLVKLLPAELARTDGLDANQKVAEEGSFRTALLTLVAGSVAVVGAVYTARTFALNRRGQVTERFMRAVDQLGNQSIDVRLGGIYALGRLAQESREEYRVIVNILSAYVREHSPWRPMAEAELSSASPPPAGIDVQAIVQMLQARHRQHDLHRGIVIDLGSTNLCGIHTDQLLLADAHLSSTQFRRATLLGADLRRANLIGAQLEGAVLIGADLTNARLQSAVLRDAHLQGANLSGAQLQRADLRGAGYDEATKWQGASYDGQTSWPEGFNHAAAGVVSDSNMGSTV